MKEFGIPEMQRIQRMAFQSRLMTMIAFTATIAIGIGRRFNPEDIRETIIKYPLPALALSIAYVVFGWILVSTIIPQFAFPIRVRMVTSSDWTVLKLTDQLHWGAFELIFVSENASTAEFDGQQIRLSQPLEEAENGEIVEMVANITLFNLPTIKAIASYHALSWNYNTPEEIFEIDRGHLGWTHVEVANSLHEEPVVVANFWWSAIAENTLNTKVVSMPHSRLLKSVPAKQPPGIDVSTLDGKVVLGYQGWFGCPGDGSDMDNWVHWFSSNNVPTANELTVDFWPDITELEQHELFATELTLPNGNAAKVFSSYKQDTVVRHFEWMEKYGIDGVALQRFLADLSDVHYFCFRNKVAQSVRIGAENTGRGFFVMYDLSGTIPIPEQKLVADWTFLVETLKITESPNYLHHNGRPIIGIWGPGFSSRNILSREAQLIISWLHSGADNPAHATILGGVPSQWRTLREDSLHGTEWAEIYRSYDIVSPWTVGRYEDLAGADSFAATLIAHDMIETRNEDLDYMPVIFPGFSWHNLFTAELNAIPRTGGNFIWRQAQNVISLGAKMIYIAMFDEVDEGTAMFKLVEKTSNLPEGAELLALDADGFQLESDWYLKVGGEIGKMLRGEIPNDSILGL